jgi:outer membrane lipoprotein-sorting protein
MHEVTGKHISLLFSLALVAGVLASGCTTTDRDQHSPASLFSSPAPLSFPEHSSEPLDPDAAAAKFNEYVQKINSIWLKSRFSTTYINSSGKSQLETGISYIISIPSEGKLYMSVQSVGLAQIIIGSNSDEYWIVDYNSREAWVGKTSISSSSFYEISPSLIHPLDIIALLALHKIPDNASCQLVDDHIAENEYQFEFSRHHSRLKTTLAIAANGERDYSVRLEEPNLGISASSRLWAFEKLEGQDVHLPTKFSLTSNLANIDMRVDVIEARINSADKDLFSPEMHLANIPTDNIKVLHD